LQVALGLIWLLDAALQYQPFMFGRGFATNVVLPSAQHNPTPVADSVTWAAHQILAHPVLANAGFATAQLAIATGILGRRTVRVALAASIAWSLAVWWFGEGLGGVLTGRASPLSGAPGAAVLYALAAILLWPARDAPRESSRDSRPHGHAARLLWVLLWGSLCYLALQPANRSSEDLRTMLSAEASGEPGFLRSLDHAAADLVAAGGNGTPIVLALLLVVSASAVLLPHPLGRIALALSIALALLIATVGENLGGILTGTATDPNTGPLLILLALGFLTRDPGPVAGAPGHRARRSSRLGGAALTRGVLRHLEGARARTEPSPARASGTGRRSPGLVHRRNRSDGEGRPATSRALGVRRRT
jgi:hypothetical protein